MPLLIVLFCVLLVLCALLVGAITGLPVLHGDGKTDDSLAVQALICGGPVFDARIWRLRGAKHGEPVFFPLGNSVVSKTIFIG